MDAVTGRARYRRPRACGSSDDAAWRLLFNAMSASDAVKAVSISGRAELAAPLLKARSVIV